MNYSETKTLDIYMLYSPLVLIIIIIISHIMKDRIVMTTTTTIRVRYHFFMESAIHVSQQLQ